MFWATHTSHALAYKYFYNDTGPQSPTRIRTNLWNWLYSYHPAFRKLQSIASATTKAWPWWCLVKSFPMSGHTFRFRLRDRDLDFSGLIHLWQWKCLCIKILLDSVAYCGAHCRHLALPMSAYPRCIVVDVSYNFQQLLVLLLWTYGNMVQSFSSLLKFESLKCLGLFTWRLSRQMQAELPLRWMAYESIFSGLTTTESDV